MNHARMIQYPNAPAGLEQEAAKLFVTVAKPDGIVESETEVKNLAGIESGSIGDGPAGKRRVLRRSPQRAMRADLTGTVPGQSILQILPTVEFAHAPYGAGLFSSSTFDFLEVVRRMLVIIIAGQNVGSGTELDDVVTICV